MKKIITAVIATLALIVFCLVAYATDGYKTVEPGDFASIASLESEAQMTLPPSTSH